MSSLVHDESARPGRDACGGDAGTLRRPRFRWSDLWKAPLHDFPMRDEILYQYLPLSPAMRVIEVGPGSGFTAFRLSRHVERLTLVDIASDNVRALQQHLASRSNVRVACADVCRPGLAGVVGSGFDTAFALEVFELLPDPGACLDNFAAVLREGGTLMVQFPNYPPPKHKGLTYFRTRDELDALLGAAGFRDWDVFALTLRPHAAVLYHELHERPLRAYRRWRARNTDGMSRSYDGTWAFRQRGRLEPYKAFLHAYWTALFAAARLGGACFARQRLEGEILGRNLLLVARR